jgi:hypothetical protein
LSFMLFWARNLEARRFRVSSGPGHCP